MQLSQLRFVLACCAFAGAATATATATAQTLVRSVPGPAAAAQFGKASLVLPDQNGDGYDDLLVGAPGFNQGRGALYCLSGAYLATGVAPSELWAVTAPPVNAGAKFGTALASVGNLTGNSAPDFVVGAPDYIPSGAFDIRGAVFLIDGSTHTVVSFIHGLPQTHFGQSIVSVGDQIGDFKTDIAVSAPDVSSSVQSTVHVVPGAAFGFVTALANISHPSHTGGWHEYGAALASGFDYDGDGKLDLAISIPNYGFSFPEAGYIEVRKANNFGLIGAYTTNVAGEHFGASIEVSADYNGDGVLDLLVGAPNSPNGTAFEVGRVLVLSGAKFVNPGLPGPIEIYTFLFGSPAPPINHSDPEPNFHFGAAVRACADLNNDGVGEILVGAPGYFTQSLSGWNFRGAVRLYSGATGTQLSGFAGSSTDRLGDALGGAVDDLDGDGFEEFVVAGSLADAGGVDSGVLKCYRLFPISPSTYCTGKVNSLGCTPAIGFSGAASASSGQPFLITASNVLNQKSGLLFHGHAASSTPFQGGVKCVANPIARTPSMSSGGSASGADCTGAFSIDFNARIASGIDPTLVAGAEIYAQYWSRDPGSASQTSLSNALRFVVHP
jgi:hypothetical protein